MTAKITIPASTAKRLGLLRRSSRATSSLVATGRATGLAPGGSVVATFSTHVRRALLHDRGIRLAVRVTAVAGTSTARSANGVRLTR